MKYPFMILVLLVVTVLLLRGCRKKDCRAEYTAMTALPLSNQQYLSHVELLLSIRGQVFYANDLVKRGDSSFIYRDTCILNEFFRLVVGDRIDVEYKIVARDRSYYKKSDYFIIE